MCGLLGLLLSRGAPFSRLMIVAAPVLPFRVILHSTDVPRLIYSFISSWRIEVFFTFQLCGMSVHALRVDACFISLGCVPRSEASGAHGKSVFTFLRNCQAVFSKGPFYISTRSVFLHSLSPVVLICISLMAGRLTSALPPHYSLSHVPQPSV